MAIVSTSTSGTNVIVTWSAPNANSASIDGYEIVFEDSTGTYVEETIGCDMSANTATTCTVAMTDLQTLLGTSADTLIEVKARAHNSNGWGEYSQVNIAGSTMETVPDQVTNLAYDASTSTNT
jgi:hypothetical protein